jgi:hypothetical protein
MRDRTGERYGKLVARRLAGYTYKANGVRAQALWECVCDCGNSSTVLGSSLTMHSTTSCGRCPNSFEHRTDNTTVLFLAGLNDVHECVIDTADFELVRPSRWYADKHAQTFYAITNTPAQDGQRRGRLKMHRLILSDVEEVDHIDHNGLNNRRFNLRPATSAQNSYNIRPKEGTSRFKGVYLRKDYLLKGKTGYYATISADRKRINLGVYDSEEQAARAYDDAAKKYHGEFAVLNFPTEVLQKAA